MNTYNTRKIISITLSVVLILAIFVVLFISLIPKTANADISHELQVEDLSTNEAKITQYTNIEGFLSGSDDIQARSSNSNSTASKINKLYEAIGITESEHAGISAEELLDAKSITVSDTLFTVNEDGSVERSGDIYNVTDSGNRYDDIIGDNGNDGYMSGRIVVVQDSSLDYVIYNKETEVSSWEAYGFNCTFTMKWLKMPTYRMTDYFTFTANGSGVFTEQDNDCTFTAMASYHDANVYSDKYQINVDTGEPSYSGGWPVYKFDLPNDQYVSASVTVYEMKMVSSARIYAPATVNEGINIVMAYAHKQVVPGDLTVSIGTSGPSISFAGTSHRVYETSTFHVPIIEYDE